MHKYSYSVNRKKFIMFGLNWSRIKNVFCRKIIVMKYTKWALFLLVLLVGCDSSSDGSEGKKIKKVRLEPEVLISKIDNKLDETSGLIWFDSRLWTFNDSGGEDEIYAMDQSGEVVVTVELDEAKNEDWEAMTQDSEYIYVGDFGNNKGDRDDLKVYRIPKDELYGDNSNLKVTAEKIKFSYASQDNFEPRDKAHEFDCEAMFSFQDHLYLFSKDWDNFITTVYKLPKEPGEYELTALNSFDVNGLVTGADLSHDEEYFTLVGYAFKLPFIYLFKFDTTQVFSEKAVFFDLGSIYDAQTEGICFINENEIVFSAEKTKTYDQRVFTINLKEYKKHLD